MKQYRVILVVDREFGDKLREIDTLTPVWIIDSGTNHSAILACVMSRKGQGYLTGITWFPDKPNTEPEAVAESMIDTIDEHHGGYVHIPPFARLTIFGAKASTSLISAVEAIGFDVISHEKDILEFTRK